MGLVRCRKKFSLIINEIDKPLLDAIVDDPKIPAQLASELGDQLSVIEWEIEKNSGLSNYSGL